MRFLVVVALVAGCGRSEECEEVPLLCQDFAEACGNGQIDRCSISHEGCDFVEVDQEQCDGAMVQSCSALGYYDGATTCVDCQRIDTTACRACASGATSCASYASKFGIQWMVANGTHVLAFRKMNTVVLFDGTSLVHVLDRPIFGAVAVPGGFLVGAGTALAPLSFDGTVGLLQPLAGVPSFASDGTRVLVAWREGGKIVSAIADPATGALLTPSAPVFDADVTGFAVASDGTQFFVRHAGKVARIAIDNTLLAVKTGFPEGGGVIWDGIALWYLGGTTLQQISATGDAIGMPRPFPWRRAIASDNKLLALGAVAGELVILGYSSETTEITRTALGTGATEGAIVKVGDQILGMWDVEETRAAMVPAP